MPNSDDVHIAPAKRKLGVLILGTGAVTKAGVLETSLLNLVKEPLSANQPGRLRSKRAGMRGEDLITHLGLEYYD